MFTVSFLLFHRNVSDHLLGDEGRQHLRGFYHNQVICRQWWWFVIEYAYFVQCSYMVKVKESPKGVIFPDARSPFESWISFPMTWLTVRHMFANLRASTFWSPGRLSSGRAQWGTRGVVGWYLGVLGCVAQAHAGVLGYLCRKCTLDCKDLLREP